VTRRDWLALATVAGANGAQPGIEKSEVFQAGAGGYSMYRIPGLVVTARGSLLAYCEARKNPKGDWGSIDIAMRRSVDGAVLGRR
jgi:sialidase-1